MTAIRTFCVVASALLLLSTPGLRAVDSVVAQQEPRPTFKAVVDAVTLDAFVHRDGTPIAGLSRDDFELRDNGKVQRIDALSTPGSAHVIVGLDVSGSVDGATLDRLRGAVRTVLGSLSPADRFSLFTFSNRLRVLHRVAVPDTNTARSVENPDAGGSTPLHDAIVLGTALARADARPSVLLLFTDGTDTASWNTAKGTIEAIRNGHVTIYPVGAGLSTAMSTMATSEYFRRPTWTSPMPGDTVRLLQSVADISGGEFLRVPRDANLTEPFGRILAQYRQRYLITYTPSDTTTPGWHRLEVRLRNRPGRVVAREGYVAR